MNEQSQSRGVKLLEAFESFGSRWGEPLATVRDVVFLAGGLLYFLGYLSWYIYSSIHSLGHVPALDSQYFVLGAVVLLMIFAPYLAVRLIEISVKVLARLSERGAYYLCMLIGLVACGLPLAWTVLFLLGRLENDHSKQWWVLGYVFGMLWLYLFARQRKAALIQARTLYIPLVVLFYVVLYPTLPLRLGGGAPRCVVLDLSPTEMSAATRQALFAGAPGEGVARSRPLALYFQSSEGLFLRPYLSGDKGVFELKQTAVRGVFPCSLETSKTAVAEELVRAIRGETE